MKAAGLTASNGTLHLLLLPVIIFLYQKSLDKHNNYVKDQNTFLLHCRCKIKNMKDGDGDNDCLINWLSYKLRDILK